MDKLASPDIPAYWCCLIVLVVGIFGARSKVKRVLSGQTGYWAHFSAWRIFAAYAIIPLLLFLLLDYTGVIKDTSLVAALVVAFAYQQIFAGNVSGISLSSSISGLWQPFQKWTDDTAAQIAVHTKRSRDKFDGDLNSFIAGDPTRANDLRILGLQYSKDPTALKDKLDEFQTRVMPAGMSAGEAQKVRSVWSVQLLMDHLRTALTDRTVGDFLQKRNLVSGPAYWVGFRKLRSASIAWATSIGLLILGALALWWFFSDGPQSRYHRWRFLKTNASDLDRFRARHFLGQRLQAVAQSSTKPPSADLKVMLEPLLRELKYKAVSPRTVEDIQRLLVDFHSPAVDRLVIPELIEALKNENGDARLHIRETLVALHDVDFPAVPLPEGVAEWVPKKDDSPNLIASHVTRWRNWWNSVPPPGP
jgi:hypothetical protein